MSVGTLIKVTTGWYLKNVPFLSYIREHSNPVTKFKVFTYVQTNNRRLFYAQNDIQKHYLFAQ
jgi:hypothetical protein